MFKINKGKVAAPRRVLLYGTHGIGKSSWAAAAPNPIFIQTEDGLSDIGVDRTDLMRDFGDVMTVMGQLYSEPHDYRTAVVDTCDWLEKLMHTAVAREKGKTSIEEIPYKAGYLLAVKHWQIFLSSLDHIRRHRGMNIILLAHAKIEKFDAPDMDTYSRYSPDLHKSASPMVQEWADEVLFARFRVDTIKESEGFNSRAKAVGDGERIVHTCEAPTHMAKRRLLMPDVIQLSFESYQQCVDNNIATGMAAFVPESNAAPAAAEEPEEEEVVDDGLESLSLDLGEPAGDVDGIVVDGSSKKKEPEDDGLHDGIEVGPEYAGERLDDEDCAEAEMMKEQDAGGRGR
jgi:hypothetical protein